MRICRVGEISFLSFFCSFLRSYNLLIQTNNKGVWIQIIQVMGNSQYRYSELQQYSPPLHDLTLAHCFSPLSIFRHIYTNQQFMEHRQKLANTQDVDRKLQSFQARYQHLYLVASIYAKVENDSGCVDGEYQLSVYYERVVTNLAKIHQLSFSDALHCLTVSLKGFQILFKSFGYFQIFQNMFHITQKGRLKVWCNQHIYKIVPQQYLLGQGRQQDMVMKVISIIDDNTDPSQKKFPIRDVLASLKKLTFANAIVALRQICRENRFSVSERLDSLEKMEKFQSLLDIYAVPKRFPKDTAVTFFPKQSREQTPSKLTNRLSNSNSSHRTANNLTPSGRGQSLDASSKSRSPAFNPTSSDHQFPQFMVGRPKNFSKSSSSSQIRSHNTDVATNNVARFNKAQGQSRLKKKYSQNRPNNQQFSYLRPNNRVDTPLQSAVIKIRPHSHLNEQPKMNQPIQINHQFQNYQRQNYTPQPQRQVSLPHFQPTYQPNHQFTNQNIQNNIRMQGNFQPQILQQPQQNILPQYQPIPQQRVIQNPTNYQYSPSSYFTNNNKKPIVHTNINTSRNSTPQIIVHPFQYQQQQSINTSPNAQKRGVSVPVKLSYQNSTPHQLKFSPIPMDYNQSPIQLDSSPSKRKEERLVTLGQISAEKPSQLRKLDRKQQRFPLSQIQSKIQLLQSFAQNRITTQQFLPNQSHALSNIKWQKSSNSGRDSQTSVFKKDILLELSSKPSEKKYYEDKKEDYSKYLSKYDDQIYTNQKLMQVFRNSSSKTQQNKSKFQQRLRKIQNKYSKLDTIKQLTRNQSRQYQPYTSYSTQDKGHYLFNEQFTATPSFGPFDSSPFKKKPQPYSNKITSITEKWQQQNICSTSNGSRGRNIQSNIDDDILEDMHNEGLFRKR